MPQTMMIRRLWMSHQIRILMLSRMSRRIQILMLLRMPRRIQMQILRLWILNQLLLIKCDSVDDAWAAWFALDTTHIVLRIRIETIATVSAFLPCGVAFANHVSAAGYDVMIASLRSLIDLVTASNAVFLAVLDAVYDKVISIADGGIPWNSNSLISLRANLIDFLLGRKDDDETRRLGKMMMRPGVLERCEE